MALIHCVFRRRRLIAASLSIATKIGVVWSGLLFGFMMTLFVAMIHLPGALASHGAGFAWTIVFREMVFAAGGWAIAAKAMRDRSPGKRALIIVARLLVAIAAIVFGVEFFLHPAGVPGIPLAKPMPHWVPAGSVHQLSDGAILVVTGTLF